LIKQNQKVLTLMAALLLSLCCATSVLPQKSESGASEPSNGKAAAGTFRFAVLGDMGTGKKEQFAVAEQVTRYHDQRPFDTVLMLGDNIYTSGKASDISPKFERPYAALLERRVKFYAVLGNHDVRNGRSVQINYVNFNMGGRTYYSFTKADGLIEFFALDSTNFKDDQLRWLDGALSVSRAKWKIPFFHHPLYSSGKMHGSDEKLRAKLEPLFVKYGVPVVLAGHEHFYERTKPQMGVLYITCGASGMLRRGNLDRRSPYFEAGNDQSNSFLYVEASKDRLRFWGVDAEGKIFDHASLKK
jgi:3',5'-cyclic AMP phosphodiesterase CpdA